ncbi:hypothetical protein JCM9279_007310 [Rhodotorula babjevae]
MDATVDVNPQAQSRFCALEDHLLIRIFSRVSAAAFDHLTICKKLAPLVNHVLHGKPSLRTTDQLVALCHHLEREPAWLAVMRTISLDDWTKFPVWAPPGGPGPTFPSGRLVAGPALVQDLLRALPLEHIRIGNPLLAAAILTREFLETNPLPDVVELEISPFLRPDDAYDLVVGRLVHEPAQTSRCVHERPDSSMSSPYPVQPYLAQLVHLPALEFLSLGAVTADLALNLLNLAPAFALAPRSLQIKHLYLPTTILMPGQLRTFAAALGTALTSFELDALILLTSLDDVLIRLPPSLVCLVVRLGSSHCPNQYRSTVAGTISAAALDLPNLVSLELKGDIVSASTFHGIQRLAHLERLTLGEHTQYDLEALLGLLPRPDAEPDAEPPRPLRRLTLKICSCPPDEEDLVLSKPGTLPVWPSGFGAQDARELLREAGLSGVVVEGSVRCAAGMCEGGGKGSACAVWCGA